MTEKEIKDMRSEEALKALKAAYRSVFSGDSGKLVLHDLAAVCSSSASTIKPVQGMPIDPFDVMKREGMRTMFLRVTNMIEKGKEQ